MTDKPIDLSRMRRALQRLDELAKEHPELVADEPTGTADWETTLAEAEQAEQMMATKKQVAVRLELELLEWIDAYVTHLNTQTPGLNLTRTDGIRVLITGALEQSAVLRPQAAIKKGRKR